MANFSAKTAVNLPTLDLFSGFGKISASSVTAIPGGFRITLSPNEAMEVLGSFVFGGAAPNVPTGGTVNVIRLAVAGVVVHELSGLSLDWSVAMGYAASQATSLAAWPVLMGAGDTLLGSSLADTLIGHGGFDSIDGGGGSDTVLYTDKTLPVAVTLNGPSPVTVQVGGLDEDVLVNVENITGGSAGDKLTGDAAANSLSGGQGDDLLQGMSGSDTIDGGEGNDTVVFSDQTLGVVLALNLFLPGTKDSWANVGGKEQDIVRGVENIIGGSGNDVLSGDGGANRLEGGAGHDTLAGLGGADVIDGGEGSDTAVYSDKLLPVEVTLLGAADVKVRVGGVDEDTLRNIENVSGGAGADTLTGDAFANILRGDGGDDLLQGMAGADVLDGELGRDTASFAEEVAAVAVTLNGATDAQVVIGGVAADILRNIENVTGGGGADALTGDGLDNTLDGGGGNDVLSGAGGNDLLIGRGGADTIDGGAGSDTASYAERTVTVAVALNGALDATVSVGGLPEDTLRNVENVTGGLGNDQLTGDAAANTLVGGGGADVLTGLDGKDVLDGGFGFDTAVYAEKMLAIQVVLAAGADAVVKVGGVAEDTIRNMENVTGGSGDDDIAGDLLVNVLEGGGGNDRLDGMLGRDTLDGGAGSDTAIYALRTNAVEVVLDGANPVTLRVNGVDEDTLRNIENLVGGTGADRFTGDAAVNTLEGGGGDDWLEGRGAADIIDGGAGVDTASFADKTQAVVLALNGSSNAVASVGGAPEDTVRNVENVVGGAGNDVLTGDSLANALTGGAGGDTLLGGLGDDVLTGGTGADVLDGGGNVDTAVYSDRSVSVVVALNGGSDVTATVGGVAEDTLRNIENLVGGSAADTLTGDAVDNRLEGGAGADVLSGLGANDRIAGGAGADSIDGGDGIDTVDYAEKILGVSLVLADGTVAATATVGGVAEDSVRAVENIVGGGGNDQLGGNAGANSLDGGAGDDVLTGGAGQDTLEGGLGSDTASYAEKTVAVSVTLNRSNAVQVLVDGQFEDTLRNIENLTGGSGDDVLGGDTLPNVLVGGAGHDTLQGGFGNDVLDGGSGVDTAVYAEKQAALSVTLNGGEAAVLSVGGVAEDTLRNIENIVGGGQDDTVTGDAQANRIEGRAGNDSIAGGGGKDDLDGGTGNDTVRFTDKTDPVLLTLNGALTSYATVAGVVEDAVVNFENAVGGSGDDVLTGDAQGNMLDGGAGADTLAGGEGDDVLQGREGSDTLDGGVGTDTASYREKMAGVVVTLNGSNPVWVAVGGVNEDTLSNIENLEGGAGADTLVGDDLANAFLGGGGKDTIDGAAGIDTALYTDKLLSVAVTLAGPANAVVQIGGTAEDTLRNIENVTGGSGDDALGGDGAANILIGGAGADRLQGGGGQDVLDGGDGVDTASFTDKTRPVVLALAAGANASATVDGLFEDVLRNIENVAGGSGDDALTGDGLANLLEGNGGSDTLQGLAGKDVLDGGAGIDTAVFAEKTVGVAVTLNGAVNATVTVGGVAEDILRAIENLVGGSGNDSFAGDGLANLLEGGGGDDRLSGGGGTDVLDGGTGFDVAAFADKVVPVSVTLAGATKAPASVGGVAEDWLVNIEGLVGGAGNDALTGDGLGNLLEGGSGNDTLLGMGGDDLLAGGAGADALDGGAGSDTAGFADKILPVVVTLNGATKAQASVGGLGEDWLVNIENLTGGSADDVLTGDAQDNRFSGLGGKDTLDGQGGSDTADYSEKTASVAVTLAGAADALVSVGGKAEDTLRNIENLVGGSAADTLTGDAAANRLEGGAGDDILRGAGGVDAIDGGEGRDTALFTDETQAIAVTLAADGPATVFIAGVAADVLRNVENVTGGSGDDALEGDALDNVLAGGGGNDTLVGGGGFDVLDGGAGSDTAVFSYPLLGMSLTLNGGVDAGVAYGFLAADVIVRNVENVVAGFGPDTIVGDAFANTIQGRAGKDALDGGAGIDTVSYAEKTQPVTLTLNGSLYSAAMVAGTIEDTIRNFENVIGGSGNDTIIGDGLDNALFGGGGDDILTGGGGSDTIDGGAGVNVAVFSGLSSSYVVTFGADATLVKGADGTDTLTNIQTLRFADKDVAVVAGSSFSIAGAAPSKQEGHTGTTTSFTFTVTRSGNTTEVQTVKWSVAGQVASGTLPADAADFAGDVLPSGTLTFAAGESQKLISVPVRGDRAGELNERFAVTLSAPSTGASLGVATAGGLIWNDDVSLSILANKAAVAEGNGGGSTAFGFTVTRSGGTSAATEVSWAVMPGAADAADFAGGVLPQGKITFAAGQATRTITVPVAADALPEPDELFTVVLYGATGGAVISGMSASAVIVSDDAITGTADGQLLMGTTGNDLFVLAGGLDTVIGGAGVDRFVFTGANLGPAATQAVSLADLDLSLSEVIDLSRIDAIAATLATNDAFSFIGPAAFSGVAGQLRWLDQGGERVIQGDVNGDKVADLTIRTPALGPVGSDWFVL